MTSSFPSVTTEGKSDLAIVAAISTGVIGSDLFFLDFLIHVPAVCSNLNFFVRILAIDKWGMSSNNELI